MSKDLADWPRECFEGAGREVIPVLCSPRRDRTAQRGGVVALGLRRALRQKGCKSKNSNWTTRLFEIVPIKFQVSGLRLGHRARAGVWQVAGSVCRDLLPLAAVFSGSWRGVGHPGVAASWVRQISFGFRSLHRATTPGPRYLVTP